MVAHQRHPLDPRGQPGVAGRGEQVLQGLGERSEAHPRGEVPQREHRVGLAATEVGLQVHDRGGVLVPGEAAQRPLDQVAEAVGQVGAGEELDRVGVVAARLDAVRDLVQVSGELGRLEVPGRDVVVGRQDLPPGSQPGRLRSVHSSPQGAAVVLVGGHPAQVEPDAAHLLGGLGRVDRCQQPFGRVERAVGVVVGEGVVVRPLVAGLTEFAGVAGVGAAEPALEGAPPLGQHPELGLGVEAVVGLARDPVGLVLPAQYVHPTRDGGRRGHALGDEGVQRGCHRLEELPDAVAVGGGHDVLSHPMNWVCRHASGLRRQCRITTTDRSAPRSPQTGPMWAHRRLRRGSPAKAALPALSNLHYTFC